MGEVLRIRCRRETFNRFKEYASEFRNYEKALINLMDYYEGKASRAPIRSFLGSATPTLKAW
jgi:hypothetical protein